MREKRGWRARQAPSRRALEHGKRRGKQGEAEGAWGVQCPEDRGGSRQAQAAWWKTRDGGTERWGAGGGRRKRGEKDGDGGEEERPKRQWRSAAELEGWRQERSEGRGRKSQKCTRRQEVGTKWEAREHRKIWTINAEARERRQDTGKSSEED